MVGVLLAVPELLVEGEDGGGEGVAVVGDGVGVELGAVLVEGLDLEVELVLVGVVVELGPFGVQDVLLVVVLQQPRI